MSFKDEQLVANLSHFIATIDKARPASVKGTYLKKCVISAAMSPGVLVVA
jgi:large subunit ribosomal protein L1